MKLEMSAVHLQSRTKTKKIRNRSEKIRIWGPMWEVEA